MSMPRSHEVDRVSGTHTDPYSVERPEVLEAGQIAGLYRALRKGREDAKDEPGAADFYYGEMEMRRLDRRGHGNAAYYRRTGKASRGRVERAILAAYWLVRGYGLGVTESLSFTDEGSRGRVERVILTAYWLVSGYGLRAWRALACLTVLIAALAIAFRLIGFTEPPQPDSYWTSLLYAFRATLSLTDDEVKLTAWGKLLQALLRITGPVLLGLALLAVRGRIKR
jgi:hypothetical protein